jgi:hypothetical protein
VISLIRCRPELAQAEMRGVAEHHGATDRPSDEEPDMIPSATYRLRRWCCARSVADHNSTDRCKMHLQHIEICGHIASEFLGYLNFRRETNVSARDPGSARDVTERRANSSFSAKKNRGLTTRTPTMRSSRSTSGR